MSLNFWSAFAPGAARGITSLAGAYGAKKPSTPTADAQPTWIDRVLEAGRSRPPEMAAQAPDVNQLINPDQMKIPYRQADVPSPRETKQQGWGERVRTMREQLLSQYNTRLPNGVVGSLVLSAKDSKKDVKRDGRSLREIMRTPAVTYRYKDEPKSAPKRPGIIAEQAPKSWRGGPGGQLIKSPAWMGAQHGAIQNLARRVEKLEKGKKR